MFVTFVLFHNAILWGRDNIIVIVKNSTWNSVRFFPPDNAIFFNLVIVI